MQSQYHTIAIVPAGRRGHRDTPRWRKVNRNATRPWAKQACLAATLITLSAVSATSAGEFHTFGPNTFSLDASSDGLVVVWSEGEPGANDYDLYRWTPEELRIIPPPAGIKNNVFFARVSPDGRQILGRGYFLETLFTASWTWNEVEGSVSVGSSDDRRIEGAAVSDTGVVVGRAELTARAFRWTRADGLQLVESTVDGDYAGQFFDVSADGRLCFGASRIPCGGIGPAFSIEGAQMVALELPDDTCTGWVRGVSPDGSTAVGSAQIGAVWRSGKLTSFEEPRSPNAISGDGRIVAGRVGTDRVAIWMEKTGMTPLEAFVAAHGVTIPQGWHLYSVGAISDDGSVLVGTAINPDGQFEGWRIVLDVDTDGDGLLDDWEENGIPYVDANGDEQRYLLDIDGDDQTDCDPEIPDLFVEIDAMAGLAPSGTAIGKVEASFALANVRLHVDLDETTLTKTGWTLDDTNNNGDDDWPTEFDDLKLTAASGTTLAGHFGSVAERDDPDAVAIREAKKKAFRYCIFAKEQDPADSTSGLGELPGNDFLVTLGLWDDGNGNGGGTTDEQAGTFMHELGHTLGLRHGGGQKNANLKPNYYSVMSYNWQTPKSWHVPGSWPLSPTRRGYSDFALGDLDENALFECLPMVLPSSPLAGVKFPHNTHDEDEDPVVAHARYVDAINWNLGDCDVSVAVDVNYVRPGYRSSGDDLLGHDDWDALQIDFREMPNYADGVHDDGDGGDDDILELTYEEHLALDVILPAHCHGDIDDDRAIDFNDLIAVLDAWGPCPGGCRADIAPIGFIDGQVDFQDLLAVLDGWGPCD